jgi:hypothetical protein
MREYRRKLIRRCVNRPLVVWDGASEKKKNEYSVVWYGKFDIILESIYNYELIARGGGSERERNDNV